METERNEILPLIEYEPLTLDAIYEEKIFETQSLRDVQWLRDSRRFSFLDKAPDSDVTTVWNYDITTREQTTLIPVEKLYLPVSELSVANGNDSKRVTDENGYFRIRGYQWASDETRLLFARLPKRRAEQGDAALYLYTLATQELRRLPSVGGEIRNAKFSPDGTRIGYVRDNDLYLYDLADDCETRLTSTGSSTLYNGRFGWVYEEELGLMDGWAWSPDGTKIAFFEVDESQVPVVLISNFDDLHTTPQLVRYPKAGDPNPAVRIGVLQMPTNDEGRTTNGLQATPPPQSSLVVGRWSFVNLGEEKDIYIARMQWTPQGDLLIQRLPRLQNRLELLKADPETGETKLLLVEEDEAWVERQGDVRFVGERGEFLWKSERDGYHHLYLYDLSGTLLRQVTWGEWDVTSIEAVDAERRVVYFAAAHPSARERQVFRASLDGESEMTRLTQETGVHSPDFAPDGAHFLCTHSDSMTPPRTRLMTAEGQILETIHDNPLPKLQNRRLGRWEFTECETSDGVALNVALLKPADFDPTKTYPVVMFTYGGPGSQVVQDQFGSRHGLEQWLTEQGYIYVLVDGRGTGARGRDFKKVTYRNLGHWEVQDMIEAAKWLCAKPFVDAERIGVWGWSYGGYVAALCILRGTDVFKAAVAVAPVTHWELYDSIYTERYMRRPQDNLEGYAVSAPLTYAEHLKGRFLLLHGTADDNVHFQNSARLAAEFQKRNLMFETMFYPGKRHGLEGVSRHVYGTIGEFFLKNL